MCRLSRVLERLPAVEVLSLAGNGLPELPASLWNCRSLKKLDLSNNQLQILPGELSWCATGMNRPKDPLAALSWLFFCLWFSLRNL